MKRTIRYFLVNGIFASSIYFGMYKEGYEGAINIAVFYGYLISIVRLFYNRDDFLKENSTKLLYGPVPLWLDQSLNLIILLSFLYKGYFLLSSFYLAGIISYLIARDSAKNIQAE